MGFFDDIGKKVTDAGQKTIQKTKDMTDIARINSLISQEENKINNLYSQIGKIYVSLHKNDCEEELKSLVASIFESEEMIINYKKQIQDIKSIQRCPNCGAEIPRGVAFCSSCGSPISQIQEKKNMDDYIKCLYCGSLVKKEMNFCTFCGKPISQIPQEISIREEEDNTEVPEIVGKICPNCGTKQTEDSLFCEECGTKL